jgi:hypothetical protein
MFIKMSMPPVFSLADRGITGTPRFFFTCHLYKPDLFRKQSPGDADRSVYFYRPKNMGLIKKNPGVASGMNDLFRFQPGF